MPATTPHPCHYCGEPTSDRLYSGTDTTGAAWTWQRCGACGAVSLSPPPTAAQLAAAYDDAYYGTRETKFDGPSEHFIEACRRARARRLARDLASGASVLDVGCGNGSFLAALGSCGNFSLHGVELEGGSARRAARRTGICLKVGVLESDDFAPESLDLVTLFHVFEHLSEPRQTLALIHTMLKPDGRLVMSFPNISGIQARLFRSHWLHLDPPRHLFLFPTHAFEKAMAEAGFSVRTRRFFSVEQNPFGLIQSCLNCMLDPRDLLYERLKGNIHYAPNHGSISILAQKVFAAITFAPAVIIDALESALGLGATVEYTLNKLPIRP